jgi:hypothetical protein
MPLEKGEKEATKGNIEGENLGDGEELLTSSSYLTNCRDTPAISANACSSTFLKVSCACANLTRYCGMMLRE